VYLGIALGLGLPMSLSLCCAWLYCVIKPVNHELPVATAIEKRRLQKARAQMAETTASTAGNAV